MDTSSNKGIKLYLVQMEIDNLNESQGNRSDVLKLKLSKIILNLS